MESFGGFEVQSEGYGGRGLDIADEHQQLGQESGGALLSACGNSFTALLELSPSQATELLHSTGAGGDTDCLPADFAGNVLNRHRIIHQIPYAHTLNCSLPFPSNAALIERAAKYSVFATGGGSHDSLYTISAPCNSSGRPLKMKSEPADSNSNPNLTSQVSDATFMCQIEKTSKRKEIEEKGKGSVKKIKTSANDHSGDGEKLPYVHVRARRGEATDSHSLAERARREKINARMKLLQELVPGCNKISGTALVLDQIINHVQNLQRQVEYLSMKLAAVNPTTDFNLDSLFAAGNGSPMGGNFQSMMTPLTWPEIQINGTGGEGHQQWLSESLTQPDWAGDEDQCNLITPENSLLSYDSSGNSVSLCPSQQKMELGNTS